MTMINNPFSKDLSSKRMFDWTFEMSAEQNEAYSLQRYKELFFYFVSCFRHGKIEILEKDLFNDTWDRDYKNSIGCKVFHLAVNCYLYYIGYRENVDCVEESQKSLAQGLLKKIISQNSRYFRYLLIDDVKETHIQLFLREAELMPKNDIGKQLILPDVVRDFYAFSLLLVCCYKTVNIRNILVQNSEIYSYRKYISSEKEKKQQFSEFLTLFCTDKSINMDTLYTVLTNTLQPIFKNKKLEESRTYLENYNKYISETELGKVYKQEIEEFFLRTFAPFSAKNGEILKLQTVELLNYRILTNFTDENLGQMSLDALLFNFLMQVIELLKKNNVLNIKSDFNKTDTRNYLNFLEEHELDFIIGSPDVIAPHDYREYEQIERFERNFKHLNTLGWFRNILALNSELLSFSIKNILIEFSVPGIDDMKDEFEENSAGLFNKKTEVEKYTREEFLELIKNTYRNIRITADISVCINSEKVGYLLIPTRN